MPAETQSEAQSITEAQIEAAFREQALLCAALSPEEYEKRRQRSIRELLEITERSSAYAEAQGMTDELLEQLLADES